MTDTPKRFPASAAPRQKASTHSGLRPPAATQSSAHFGHAAHRGDVGEIPAHELPPGRLR